VDRERRGVDRVLAVDDLAVVVHQDEVADPDVRERHRERVDPEVVGELGVARRDVAGDALLEAELGEQPEPRGEALLAVQLVPPRPTRTSAWRGTSARAGSTA